MPSKAPTPTITKLIERPGHPAIGEQRAFELVVGGAWHRFAAANITLGSSSRCDLTFDDPTVSRHHARIEVADDKLMIRDLGSRNGTTVNGVQIVSAMLGERARLTLGATTIEFRLTTDTEPFAVHPVSAFGRLRGSSIAMRRMFAILDRISPTETTALVLGESGSGKELIAEAIHQRSRRASGPFVVVDCGALPATLIESELFGHERGAFTGAVAAREGAFELARGGTILLDEIGELDLGLQPRLLRALDARKVKRLGGDRYRDIDVRVIAATNRDLPAMVSADDFREDLYHRLAVIELRVPPLRDRAGDIGLLARMFAEQLAELHGVSPARIDDAWIAGLAHRSWPGNVRELRNHVERQLVIGGLDDELSSPSASTLAPPSSGSEDVPAGGDDVLARSELLQWPYAVARQHVLDQFERSYVAHALTRANHNVARAAREMKLERSYLFKLIRRHRLRTQ